MKSSKVRALTVALLARYQSLIRWSENDGGNLLVSCDLLVKEIGFAAFTEVAENLSGNLTAGEHRRLGLIPLFYRGDVRVNGHIGGHIVIGVTVRGYRIAWERDLGR